MFFLHHQYIYAVVLIESLARSNIDQALCCALQYALAAGGRAGFSPGSCCQGMRSGTD